MFLIPGQLLTMITFPGVLTYELLYLAFSRSAHLQGTPNTKKLPTNFQQAATVIAGPFVISSMLCFIFAFIAGVGNFQDVSSGIFLYLALCIGMHAFPSNEVNAQVLVIGKKHLSDGHQTMHNLASVYYHGMNLFNILRFFWIDLVYAIIISVLAVYVAGQL
ncbi:MAG: hypothetical protein WC802_00450 [Patescibacteria group bacterium]|jgi:hypothetical protein